ncbi:(Fe-S)-binding protein [Lacticaseibacillus nasuensis]|uniref:(Fe-S)-binding protein n=1 Tax=Lacticaseibacillus nasuensis TaxID=944671 RepID=UPI00224632CE|nr:(Fe-S)-binding protein [Lacticaseibacillus nasuensis]MCX2454935.1 (Fe-S)-binding protein [Lacticaseibacillus nasuensis]
MKVVIFSTCVVDLVFPNVGKAMVEVLERFGCDTELPSRQICCSQITNNSGYVRESQKVMRNEVDSLLSIDADYIVGPAGSCVNMLKEYVVRLRDDPVYLEKAKVLAAKTYEFSQFLYYVLGVSNAGAELDATATYHRSCHMTRLLGERHSPYALLARVKGLNLLPLPNLENCCGFGGMFSMKEPEISKQMVDEKVDSVLATNAQVLISCDPACLMNIGGRFNRRGEKITIMHLAEVLNHNVDMSRVTYDKDDPLTLAEWPHDAGMTAELIKEA